MSDFMLQSPVFDDNESIPETYTCDGADINPPLTISGVPQEAESLALIVDDPDAVEPAGKVWDHWVIWNIAPDTPGIEEDSVPADAVQGRTDFGHNQYGGPCPPDGEHTYRFILYALDAELDLPAETTKDELQAAMDGHVITKTTLHGRYDRQ